MPAYAPYLRRMDGILLDDPTRIMVRDQIKNAVEVMEGVHESLIGEHVPRRYVCLIMAEILAEALDG